MPTLNEIQSTKLKQLSLMTLCANSDLVPYDTIRSALDLSADSDELEGLVIETIYSGQLTAKLDTQAQRVEVSQVGGRDVDASRMEEISAILDQFEEKTALMVKTTQTQIEDSKSQKTVRTLELEEYNQKISVKMDPKRPLDSKLKKRNRA